LTSSSAATSSTVIPKTPRSSAYRKVALLVMSETSTVGGSRQTLVSDEQVVPYGMLRSSTAVTTVTPVGKQVVRQRCSCWDAGRVVSTGMAGSDLVV
jgi:hypothetical protein